MGVECGSYSYIEMRQKEERDRWCFLHRENDIDLGPTFNAMRAAQRQREWDSYRLCSQMANRANNAMGYSGSISGLGSQLGSLAAARFPEYLNPY